MLYTEMENLGGNQQWEKRIEDIVEKKEKGGGASYLFVTITL